ncbi:hypothetical protein HBF26_18180 [Luteibacter jiangsuensis]|uniref:Uncharacterized protein n=1 Tax=Luteibacter jiangsuensis TaxID=637577 RepID=A0ABX0Q8D4_9GAMM|nr:hypothetical protein [Luteibacter jiangsuensis]NID06820.1 hypothetical protein [Luteibacter jiangsuensis]
MGNEHIALNAAGKLTDLASLEVVDLRDRIGEYVSKARALSMMTWADQGESFRNLSHDVRDEFMWALSGMLDEVKAAWDELGERKAFK